MTIGVIHLCFYININIYEVFFKQPEIIESKKKLKITLKAMMTILFVSIMISPAIIGYFYNYQQARDPIYLVVNNVGKDGAINITTIVTRPYYIPTTNITSINQDWEQILTCEDQNPKAYFDPYNSLVKERRNLIIGLGNKENQATSCYEQLLATDAEVIKLLKYQSIIMLEDEGFEFRTSRRINFNINPNFPIVAVR